jgi:hypothetical protein
MGAHDRPFPPGGLPPDVSRIFKMAFDLGYQTKHMVEKHVVEGEAGQTAVRNLGQFEIRVEFLISANQDLMSYTVMIWFEEHLVFNVWCSRVGSTLAEIGLVVTCEDGPWKFHLRRHSESDEKF